MADVGLGGGSSLTAFLLMSSFFSSLTPKLCLGKMGLGLKSSLF